MRNTTDSNARDIGRRSTRVTWILVVVALAAALVVAGCVGEENNRKLTIIGTTAGAQTNYQMKLTVYNSSGTDTPGTVYLRGNARSDFGDIRFTKSDGVTLLDYWIESYTPGVSAVVWVKVDSIPASPNTANIYLYYGNPWATSASNGSATFAFFDDFEDGDYTNNPAWSVEAGAFSVQNEILDSKTGKRLYSSSQGSRIKSTSTLAQNGAWEWDYYNQGRDGYGNALQQGLNYFIYLDDNNWAGAGAYYSYRFLVVVGGSAVINYDSGSDTIATGILHYKVTRNGNTWTFYVDDVQKYQGTVSGLTSSALTKYSVSASAGDSASYPNRIDNFRYYNYSSPEPTWGW